MLVKISVEEFVLVKNVVELVVGQSDESIIA